LGAEVLMVSRMGDGQMEVPENLKDKIMHARLRIGENELYMSDTFDPSSINKGNNVSLSIQIDDATQLEKSFNRLSAGGNVTMPLQKTFWATKLWNVCRQIWYSLDV
jgi:PhnB protein